MALPAPLTFRFPATFKGAVGAVVPIPTFPAFGSVTIANLFVTVPAPPGKPTYNPVKLLSVLPVARVDPDVHPSQRVGSIGTQKRGGGHHRIKGRHPSGG